MEGCCRNVILLDAYERRARFVPGFVTLLPVAITILGLGLKAQPVIAATLGLLSAIGAPFILVSRVRSAGVVLQERLVREWDGLPSRHALRLRSGGGQDAWPLAQREAWRAAVEQIVGVILPSAEQEALDPQGSDGIYDAAVAKLRGLTRDKQQFPLVFEENRNYGYERNLLAVRWAGLAVAIVCLLGAVILGLINSDWLITSVSRTNLWVLSAIDLLVAVFWCVFPGKSRVLLVARRYTDALMEGTLRLAAVTPTKEKGKGKKK
jgi:hypothetical protein